jgi:hypothetical protein
MDASQASLGWFSFRPGLFSSRMVALYEPPGDARLRPPPRVSTALAWLWDVGTASV